MQVSVNGRTVVIPRYCACCTGPAVHDIASEARGANGVVHTYNFHYCDRCAGHIRLYLDRKKGLNGIWVFGWLFSPFACVSLFIAAVLASSTENQRMATAKRGCSSACASVAPVTYKGWYGADWYGAVQTFEIPNQQYATAFLIANRAKIINASAQIVQILQAHDARLRAEAEQAAIAAQAAALAPPPATRGKRAQQRTIEAVSPAQEAPAAPMIAAAAQIRELGRLRDEGLITTDEFETKKRELLGLPLQAQEPFSYPQRRTCTNCGVPIQDDATECGFCGLVIRASLLEFREPPELTMAWLDLTDE